MISHQFDTNQQNHELNLKGIFSIHIYPPHKVVLFDFNTQPKSQYNPSNRPRILSRFVKIYRINLFPVTNRMQTKKITFENIDYNHSSDMRMNAFL